MSWRHFWIKYSDHFSECDLVFCPLMTLPKLFLSKNPAYWIQSFTLDFLSRNDAPRRSQNPSDRGLKCHFNRKQKKLQGLEISKAKIIWRKRLFKSLFRSPFSFILYLKIISSILADRFKMVCWNWTWFTWLQVQCFDLF